MNLDRTYNNNKEIITNTLPGLINSYYDFAENGISDNEKIKLLTEKTNQIYDLMILCDKEHHSDICDLVIGEFNKHGVGETQCFATWLGQNSKKYEYKNRPFQPFENIFHFVATHKGKILTNEGCEIQEIFCNSYPTMKHPDTYNQKERDSFVTQLNTLSWITQVAKDEMDVNYFIATFGPLLDSWIALAQTDCSDTTKILNLSTETRNVFLSSIQYLNEHNPCLHKALVKIFEKHSKEDIDCLAHWLALHTQCFGPEGEIEGGLQGAYPWLREILSKFSYYELDKAVLNHMDVILNDSAKKVPELSLEVQIFLSNLLDKPLLRCVSKDYKEATDYDSTFDFQLLPYKEKKGIKSVDALADFLGEERCLLTRTLKSIPCCFVGDATPQFPGDSDWSILSPYKEKLKERFPKLHYLSFEPIQFKSARCSLEYDTDLNAFKNCYRLTFGCASCGITDFTPLKEMQQLRLVVLYEIPQFMDLNILAEIPHLQTLDLQGVSISDAILNTLTEKGVTIHNY